MGGAPAELWKLYPKKQDHVVAFYTWDKLLELYAKLLCFRFKFSTLLKNLGRSSVLSSLFSGIVGMPEGALDKLILTMS